MQNKGHTYQYYHCRLAFGHRATHLHRAQRPCECARGRILREIQAVLSDPSSCCVSCSGRLPRRWIRAKSDGWSRRSRRLLSARSGWFGSNTYGEVDDGVVRDEGGWLERERLLLEARLLDLRPPAVQRFDSLDRDRLNEICAAVAAWLDPVREPERVQVLEALRIGVQAQSGSATVSGVLPL
jgi:hypothetical protein